MATVLVTEPVLPRFYEPVRLDGAIDNLVVSDCELQTHLRIDPDAWLEEHALVRLYAAAAQEEAERFTRRAIGPGTYQVAPAEVVASVYLRNIPITQILSVSAAGSPVSYTALDYMGLPLLLLPAASPNVVVQYEAGYAEGSVPPMLRAWILLATANLYENREAHSTKPVLPNAFASNMLMPFKVTLVFA
jgi:hypothetical protein